MEAALEESSISRSTLTSSPQCSRQTNGHSASKSGPDTLPAQLWNPLALQRYILCCCQDKKGGLRDKPSKSVLSVFYNVYQSKVSSFCIITTFTNFCTTMFLFGASHQICRSLSYMLQSRRAKRRATSIRIPTSDEQRQCNCSDNSKSK